MHRHTMIVATPVVYTNVGGGPDEVQAPATGGPNIMPFPVPTVDYPGGKFKAAWYCPLDNIDSLPAIHDIQCRPDGTGANVLLQVNGRPGQPNARVRIIVYAMIDVP
jgi:hypothetical protein